MTLCHFVCGSLEQNHGHGWPVSALPGSFLPPLMTSKTTRLQKISILTSCSSFKPLMVFISGQDFFFNFMVRLSDFMYDLTDVLYIIGIRFVFPFLEVNGSSKIQSGKRSRTCLVSLHQKSQDEALETRREASSQFWIHCQLLLISLALSRYRRGTKYLKSPDLGSSYTCILGRQLIYLITMHFRR